MKLKFFFQSALLGTFMLSSAMASGDHKTEDQLLIVGCRPWDKNIEEVKGLNNAHFMDFMIQGAPEPKPARFHHIDFNNENKYDANNLSHFADSNPAKFSTIIIDWLTYHHVRRDTAWADFATLLKPGGQLVVPVTFSQNLKPYSQEKAKELIEDKKFSTIFNSFNVQTYDTIPSDGCFDLLRRSCIKEVALSFNPAIIFATKQGAEENIELLSISKPVPAVSKPSLASYNEADYREIKLPTLEQLRTGLIEGKSFIASETGDFFYFKSIGLSGMHGFRLDSSDVDNISYKQVLITSSNNLFII